MDMGRKFGKGALSPFWEGQLGPHLNPKSLGPRPSSIPSGIVIHPAIWPQQIWAENWETVHPGGRELGPIRHNVARAEAYLHAKFHLDPSNGLAAVHQRYRQTG